MNHTGQNIIDRQHNFAYQEYEPDPVASSPLNPLVGTSHSSTEVDSEACSG